jgi:hypothetical protein
VFDALLGDKSAASSDGEDLSKLVGTYIANFGPFKDAKFEVTEKDGKLFVDVPGQMNYEIAAPGKDGRRPFAMTDTVAVSFEDAGKEPPNVMRMHQGGLDFELLREGYTPPPEIPLAELKRFEGAYESDEGTVVTVSIQNNRLAIDIPKQMTFELFPPDDKGLRKFRIKPGIAVEFVGKKPDALKLHQDGKAVEFKRTAAVKTGKLPTVAALQAKRGVKKLEKSLDKVGLVEVHGKVRMVQTGLEGDLRLVYGKDRVHVVMDMGRFGLIEELVTPQGAWGRYPASPLETHEGKFLTQARLGLPLTFQLDWTKSFDKVELVDRGVLNGRDIFRVEMTVPELGPYRVSVAADDGEVLQVEYGLVLDGAGTMANTVRYGDYRKTLGARVPHRIEVSNDPNGRTVWTIESAKPFKGDPSVEFRPLTDAG